MKGIACKIVSILKVPLPFNRLMQYLCLSHPEGFVNMEYWTTSFNAMGSEPAVVCDGSAS